MSNTPLVIGGLGIALGGLVQLVVAIRGTLPRFQVAQGLGFVELGLALAVLGALPPGPLRTSVASVLLLGTFWALAVQHRLQRAWRREHEVGINGADGD
ncbi:MAG: hypothetical protein ACF8LL_09430, partial [Phycisphaerales bacterium]